MTSEASEIKLIPRGAARTLLLIPGWATDYRIFASLELPYNYLVPIKFAFLDFEKRVLRALEENALDKISILGWSMGAYLAADFAAKHKDRIDELILAAVRRRYKLEGLEVVRAHLERSTRGYLHSFYNECSIPKELKNIYLEEMDRKAMMEGLDYLTTAEIVPERLKGLNVEFVHGEKDKIAPIDEVRLLAKELEGSRLTEIKDAGHFPYPLI